jgi:KUP system potassium uptake protein
MYADMGHFGAKPIKISWITIVFPALLLNYLGQGAFLLGGEAVKFNNVFYSAVPAWGIFPMVIISTLATIIASQALISGAFSLTSQAISLGFLPKIRIKHTNEGHEGQIYISAVNWLLYAGCVILVLVFRSSTNLAAAYGLAVSAIMLLTSTATILVSHYLWKWNWLKSILVFIPFLLIESLFFSANSLKLVQGGWIPLTIALVIYAIMQIWQWGRKYVEKTYKNLSTMKISELIKLKQSNSRAFSHPSIFMTPSHIKSIDDKVPALLEVFWKRYNILPQDLILLNIHVSKEPYSHGQRYEILPLYNDKEKGHITFIRMNFGFMEEHNVEKILQTIMHDNAIPIPDCEGWLIHIISEKILFLKKSFIDRGVFSVYKVLANNSETADEYFGLGKDYELTIESVPVKII